MGQYTDDKSPASTFTDTSSFAMNSPTAGLAKKSKAPSAAAPTKATPAELAKAVLRRLGAQRQEPTPANYLRAWREEGGEEVPEPLTPAARRALQDFAARVLPAGVAREPLVDALGGARWEQLAAALPEDMLTPAQQAEAWADLIDRLVRQLERNHKGWTTGRKKDSLQHVLGSARSDVQRLQQRLRQLVSSWDGDAGDDKDVLPPDAVEVGSPTQIPGDHVETIAPAVSTVTEAVTATATMTDSTAVADAPVVVDATDAVEGLSAPDATPWRQVCGLLESAVLSALPAAEPRADEVGAKLQAVTAQLARHSPDAATLATLDEACEDVRRVLQHRHHLVAQLGVLINDLTEGLSDLSEDDSWVRGQCQAMRSELDQGLSARGVRAMGNLLADTRARQQQLRVERTQARDALKVLIHRMLRDLGELGSHTGQFNQNLGRYADVIGQADSLEGLTHVVREMVEETRTVHSLVSQTSERLTDEHQRATVLSDRVKELEDELRRLSDEVSTDQLTQIANRRGLIRHFSVESARAQRQGTDLAIGILDLDNFKRVNDNFGHQTGDEALKFLSRRVVEILRPHDTLARYGGEEFVVLLPDTAVEEAQQVLTRVQRLLSAELFMHEGKQTFITFSAGVTRYRPDEPLEAVLQRADEALYEAKRNGKNRTCIG